MGCVNVLNQNYNSTKVLSVGLCHQSLCKP